MQLWTEHKVKIETNLNMKGLPILTDDTITRFWSLGHRNMK